MTSRLKEMIAEVVARDERLWRKHHPGESRRFPHHDVSRPKAKLMCEMAGVRVPRPGWQIDLGVDEQKRCTWVMSNRSGTLQIWASYF